MKRKVNNPLHHSNCIPRFKRPFIHCFRFPYKPALCKLFLVVLIGFFFSVSRGQLPYSLIHYDENVLPQTSIGNILQDANGYLWMGTQFGIVRFDGEQFRTFTTENLQGLSSNRIRLGAKGPDQSIYFVDENSVIIKVMAPNSFTTTTLADALKESKPLYTSESNNDFAFLSFDKRTGYNKLASALQFDPARELLKVYALNKKQGYFMYIDLQQKIRICYYDGQDYTLNTLADSFKSQHSFKLNNQVFNQVSSTRVMRFTAVDQQQEIPLSGLPAQFEPVFREDAIALFSNESGTFFYASGQLYQYSFAAGRLSATLVFEHLPCSGVVDIIKEKSTGDFLISTKSNGFYRIKRKQFGVVNLTGPKQGIPGANNGFNSNIVYSLEFWNQQQVFCNGYITPVSGTGVSRHFDPANKARFNHYFLYAKDDDHVWINVNDGAKSLIQSYDKKSGTYSNLLEAADPKKIIEFSNGTTIVIAGRSIAALQKGRTRELVKIDSTYFTTAEKISEDCVLLGTANGLCFFYPRTATLREVPYKERLKVRHIFKDKAGRIWCTTYGQGLFYLSGNLLTPLPLDNAGYLAIGHSIFEDNSGHFWVPTNHGLFKLPYESLLSVASGKSSKLYYTYFDKTDGFNTNEFNGGCFPSGAYQKETGLLFFPSMDGIVKFNPDSIHRVNSNGSIFFDEIVLNDTGSIYHVTDRLLFPSQTSTLRLFFSSPYYGHVENVKFSYALSNDPNHWIDLRGDRNLVLTNLPGGSYTVTLKKEDATNAPILAALHFEIQRKFSETVLFKLLVLAGVVALVYLYFRTRLHYLSNERKRLEREVTARTADQLNLIDQLKNNIARLKRLQSEKEEMIEHKENVIAVLIHDIKSPLHFLNTVASHLDKGIELNAPAKNKKIASEIASSLNRLFIFTQDFAIWLEASRPGYIQKREMVDLQKIVGEALTIYKEIIEKKDIGIGLEMSAGSVFGDEPMIKSVIRNLVDNAVKNTASGRLSITAGRSINDDTCEIIIADEGKGMSGEDLNALNSHFQYHDDVRPFSTSGFGHKIIRDFLVKLDGEISYAHNHPTGVIVTLKLPLFDPSKPGPGVSPPGQRAAQTNIAPPES